MEITRIQLRNIKSYREANIPLRRGTTAIRGHNGAGKSTLVEAVGWALFDALPYSQNQFVREGERWGEVTVAFRSAEDDREYEVVRRAGSSPAWYVYDPELDARAADQKVDVLDFLRRHLRIEGEIAADALFTDALGVPQGSLTADFLLTPAHRKKKFDALLQVEDFRHAAEKLNETRGYLQDELHTAEAAIARLERETSDLTSWRADLTAHRDRERQLGTHLAATQRQHDEAAVRRDQLLARERTVRDLAGKRDVARVAAEAAEAVAQQARERVAEAEEADRIRGASLSDHEAYQHAETELGDVRRRAQTRDHRLRQRADLAAALAAANRDAAHARAQLELAQRAEARVVELAPLVERQYALMTRREALTRDTTRLTDAQATLRDRDTERTRLAAEIAQIETRLREIAARQPEADLLAERRARLDTLNAEQATRAERETRLRAIASEISATSKKRAEAAGKEAKAEENLRKLDDARRFAERVPALEAEQLRLRGDRERLLTTIQHHRDSRSLSAGGQCPFLREPCLNIQRRGLSSLETYFDGEIARDEQQVAPLDERLGALEPALARAREAATYYARLEGYRNAHEQAASARADLDERRAALEGERAGLEESLAAFGGANDLADAVALAARSAEATTLVGQMGPLGDQLGSARRGLADAEGALERTQALISELAAAPAELKTVDSELATLGDPRTESAREAGVARARPAAEEELTRRTAACQSATDRLSAADEALKPFAGLDAEIATLETRLGATRPGHTRYLEHKQAADRLPERRSALAAAADRSRAAAQEHERAVADHERALVGFEPEALRLATDRASALHAELGRATEELKSVQARIAEREAAIAAAEALLGELVAARGQQATVTELLAMLAQFRETIKEAGPYVMRALLRQISIEANRIFGEVLGDRSAQLAWEDDYEIVLRRDGQERRFAQLSGGEQMSAALAVRLALLRSFSHLDIAFFDEPTQNMDGERRGNLAEQLRRVHGFDQLIVISHDDTFEQGLDSVIHLEKRGGETRLVEEDALVGATYG